MNSKVDALEAQLQAMQAEISRLKAKQTVLALAQMLQSSGAGSVDASVKATGKKEHQDNTLFFRGGYAHANNQEAVRWILHQSQLLV